MTSPCFNLFAFHMHVRVSYSHVRSLLVIVCDLAVLEPLMQAVNRKIILLHPLEQSSDLVRDDADILTNSGSNVHSSHC